LFFETKSKIDRPLANLTKMKKKLKSVKSEMQKGRKQGTPPKSRNASETTLRANSLINLKFLKKWTDF
jgi:hypothetical protein